jgi:hypothetical protein
MEPRDCSAREALAGGKRPFSFCSILMIATPISTTITITTEELHDLGVGCVYHQMKVALLIFSRAQNAPPYLDFFI